MDMLILPGKMLILVWKVHEHVDFTRDMLILVWKMHEHVDFTKEPIDSIKVVAPTSDITGYWIAHILEVVYRYDPIYNY